MKELRVERWDCDRQRWVESTIYVVGHTEGDPARLRRSDGTPAITPQRRRIGFQNP